MVSINSNRRGASIRQYISWQTVLLVFFLLKESYDLMSSPTAPLVLNYQNSPLFVSDQSSTTAIDNIMSRLSDRDLFLPTIEELYQKYGKEIAQYRPSMRKWCEKTDSCKFCDLEAEMLYMLVRETKPNRLFEMAPNKGYSTHWILKACHENKKGELHSFDIHDTSVELMEAPGHEKRWKFILGDYQKLLESGELVMENYDFIFIDALHTEEFSRGYCLNLLAPYQKTKAIVAIHDIVADKFGGGRESSEVYKFLAFAKNAKNIFTMSRFTMPSMAFPLPDGVAKVNQIRAKMNIVNHVRQMVRVMLCTILCIFRTETALLFSFNSTKNKRHGYMFSTVPKAHLYFVQYRDI